MSWTRTRAGYMRHHYRAQNIDFYGTNYLSNHFGSLHLGFRLSLCFHKKNLGEDEVESQHPRSDSCEIARANKTRPKESLPIPLAVYLTIVLFYNLK